MQSLAKLEGSTRNDVRARSIWTEWQVLLLHADVYHPFGFRGHRQWEKKQKKNLFIIVNMNNVLYYILRHLD